MEMTNSKITAIFRLLGLSSDEQAIYLALWQGGGGSIRHVAELSGVNRGKAYELLKRLVSLGLVRYKQTGQRRRFQAEPPSHLHNLVEEKRHELTHAEEQIKALMPALVASGIHRSGEPITRFYEDDEGIVAILRDCITTAGKSTPKSYYVYSSKPLRTYLYRRFPNFTRRRIAEGIGVKVIAIGEGGEDANLAERKWLPEINGSHSSSYVLIYGTKMAVISLSANNTPYGVVIDDPGLSTTQKLLFEALWERL